jgi:hypothetical protein
MRSILDLFWFLKPAPDLIRGIKPEKNIENINGQLRLTSSIGFALVSARRSPAFDGRIGRSGAAARHPPRTQEKAPTAAVNVDFPPGRSTTLKIVADRRSFGKRRAGDTQNHPLTECIMASVSTYRNFCNDSEAVFNFYASVFATEIQDIMRHGEVRGSNASDEG